MVSSIAILVVLLFVVGCLNYKSYDLPQEGVVNDQVVDEIAKLEEEIQLQEQTQPEEAAVVEEIVLPELSKEPQEEVILEEDMPTLTVQENEFIKVKATITDADKDPVQYAFTKPLNQLGEWKTNYGDAGEYIVTLSATDGKLTTTKKVKIAVQRVNVPPVIEGVRDLLVREGELVTFQPKVMDPNNDHVTITTTEPLKSGSFSTDHTSAGEYQITVVATDGELETEKSFKLTVQDVNKLPVVNGVADITVKEGEIVMLEPEVSDLDNDEITITISDPIGDDGEWTTSFTDHGEYIVTVIVNDGKDTVTKKTKITVEDVNMPPEIVDIALETR